ncbi:hypothetical protein BFR04_00950 [Gaetbulibacter sp. 4G1]|nr:hypothetical protein BFR04_00950 [Gaetbulibacter sp. 4G1]
MKLDLIENLNTETVELEKLFLNPNNPRLMGKSRKVDLPDNRVNEEKIQNAVLRDIKQEGISDLYEKIKKLGFLSIDRIVVRKISESDNYIVLEGNRRISTVKTLLNEHQEGIITLDSNILESLKNIEVLVYSGADKNIIWLLQGMRHINGIKEWGALQQARFLVEMQKEESLSATELDKMTGFGRNTISRKIRSFKAFEFCQEFYHGELDENNFSLFQEAIFTKPQIKEWLSWNDDENKFENSENLESLLNWYVGDEEGNKRIERVLDIRDHFNKLLIPENKSILVKFIEVEDFSINEAIQEIRDKDAEKNAQKHQLDLGERILRLNDLYTELSTLPMVNILKSADKDKFKDIIEKINESASFQLTSLGK